MHGCVIWIYMSKIWGNEITYIKMSCKCCTCKFFMCWKLKNLSAITMANFGTVKWEVNSSHPANCHNDAATIKVLS
jgi:hypothetical protein